jgi:hypothetical protein
MPRKLAADMRELTSAFDYSEGITFYLDLDTGAVLHITDDTLFALEDTPLDDDNWQQEAVNEARQIQDGLGTRYLEISQVDSFTGYNDVVEFIAAVEDEHLRDLLDVAIRGKGAFRRFKDVLYDYSESCQQWFEFKDEQMRQRVMRWLAAHDIETEG